MQILVTSPIPSHPQNHGNRARVYSLCRTLQQRGYKIHFVYGGLEGLSEAQELAMRDTWEHVYIIPKESGAKKQSRRNHHLIDDWYVPAVGEVCQRIMNIWKIDICLANYVWFSKWLEDVPAGTPKYLDTHDMFAGRHKNLRKDGLEASWYSTTAREEAKALNRADVVLAIQHEEAEIFRKACRTDVATLGHYLPANFLPAASGTGRRKKIKVGYLASNNPINQHSLHILWQEIAKRPALMESFSFELAGAVSTCDVAQNIPFKKHGFVPSPESFYENIDIILNPNLGGTGLKIKSVEALAFGKALLATADAMAGITSDNLHHQYQTIADLCDGLQTLAADWDGIKTLQKSGQAIFAAYQQEQKETLAQLFPNKQQMNAEEEIT